MSDLESFFEEVIAEPEQAAAEPEKVEVVDEPETPLEVPEPVENTVKDEPMVPLSVLMAEREKWRSRQEPEPVQEVYEPNEQEVERQQVAFEAVQRISRHMAIKEHGAEKVEAAMTAWNEALSNGSANGRDTFYSDHPFDFVVGWHEKQQIVASLTPDEIAEFRAFQASKQAPASPPAVLQQAPRAPVIRSTASLPSAPPVTRSGKQFETSEEAANKLFG